MLSNIKKIVEDRLNDFDNKLSIHLIEFFSERKSANDTILHEAKRNVNIIKMGRIQKIRRRIRRNSSGKIVIQKNVKRSGVKGFRISGNTVKRIPALARLKKARLLKRSWKTTRRAKLRRTLLKRKLSMRRRRSLGI